MEARPPFPSEPALDPCTFVCTVVVHDQVHFLILWKLPFEVIEEPNELAAAVTLLTRADHFAVEDVECGEQSRRAVTLVTSVRRNRSVSRSSVTVSVSSKPSATLSAVLGVATSNSSCNLKSAFRASAASVML